MLIYVPIVGHTHTHTHAHRDAHSPASVFSFFLTVLWLCPSPLLVEQSDYCRRCVCALAVMRSLWRLAIVWPKNIFVVAQPLRTGLGQSLDPRETQMPFIFSCFVFLCLSHSSVVLIWCFSSCFVCVVFFGFWFFFSFKQTKMSKTIKTYLEK